MNKEIEETIVIKDLIFKHFEDNNISDSQLFQRIHDDIELIYPRLYSEDKKQKMIYNIVKDICNVNDE